MRVTRLPEKKRHTQCATRPKQPGTWALHGEQGSESVKVGGPLWSDNGDILKSAAVAGLGIALLPTFIVGPDLHAGRLQIVLQDYCLPEISVYAVFPSRRYVSAKVRTFVEYLAAYFGDEPQWDRY